MRRVTEGERVLARARALVGTRFRPQGRRQEHGLDCVGLIALAAGLPAALLPADYRMRSEVADEALPPALGDRMERVATGDAAPGDVLLVRAGVGQHHFLVLAEHGFIHADAGLGKVVETPGAVVWPIIAAWRILEIG